jgi:hypothetical protein
LKIRINNIYSSIIAYDGCIIIGIDLMTLKVKYECVSKDIDLDNLYLRYNLDSQPNVIITDIIIDQWIITKCIKDIFDKKRFSNCIGGFIIIALFF